MVKTMESPEDRSEWVSIRPSLKALWSWSTYLFVCMCIFTYCWWKALLIGVSFLPSTVCTLVCWFDYVKIDLFIVVLKSFKFQSEFLSVFLGFKKNGKEAMNWMKSYTGGILFIQFKRSFAKNHRTGSVLICLDRLPTLKCWMNGDPNQLSMVFIRAVYLTSSMFEPFRL